MVDVDARAAGQRRYVPRERLSRPRGSARAQPDVLQVVEDSWDAAHNPVYDLAGRRANWQRVRVFTSTVYNKIVSSVIEGDTAPAAAIDEGAAARVTAPPRLTTRARV